MLKSAKIIRVAGVQRGIVCMGGGCDQQVHRASAGLTSGSCDRGREAAVAGRHHLIEGERIETALKNTQSPQAFGAHLSRPGDQDPEVRFPPERRGIHNEERDARDKEEVRPGVP